MNCGDALVASRSVSSSTILPTLYQSAALYRYEAISMGTAGSMRGGYPYFFKGFVFGVGHG